MKNTKIKIILSTIIFLSVLGFVGIVNAEGASLYVSPTSLIKTAGNSFFSVLIGLTASGNKVCSVEGTLVFNNLSCQSITVASDVVTQSSPTCLNPHFLIDIPNCTTSDKRLLKVPVEVGSTGRASISLAGVNINGNYVPTPTPPPITETTQQITLEDNLPTQEPTQQVETPTQQAAPENNLPANEPTQQVETPAKQAAHENNLPANEPTQQVETPAQQTDSEDNLPTNVGAASLASFTSGYFWPLLIILIIISVGYCIYCFVKRMKK